MGVYAEGRAKKLREKILGPLHEILIAPFARCLSGATRVIVIPHRELHGIPFAALWDAKRSSSLLERHAIVVSPSASAWQSCRSRSQRQTSRRALVVAAPDVEPKLQHAEAEARVIAELLGTTECHVGREATVASFLERAPGTDIIHLVCHGEWDERAPLMSALRLTPTADDRGALPMHAVRDVDLRGTRLAVLSACVTGRVVTNRGDETMGLSRAFLEAGVPSLLVTLWHVDDASSMRIMVEFYRHLRAGLRPADALAAAQRDLARGVADATGAFSSPYHWAPFVVLGDG
ncbi:MAG: CHAT domain-containing protein [Polyangiales bacterium]